MGDLERELKSGYPDVAIHIRNATDGMIHEFTVPNPYRALAYREDRRNPVNFANPKGYGGSAKDLSGNMYSQNIKLLEALAPPSLIADSAMAIALLESLWFCGSNPTVSNDPRCYPARILGELREWQANKDQTARGRHAKEVIDADSSWGVTKQLMTALENAVAGATEFPYIEVRMGVQKNKPKPTPTPAPTPAPVVTQTTPAGTPSPGHVAAPVTPPAGGVATPTGGTPTGGGTTPTGGGGGGTPAGGTPTGGGAPPVLPPVATGGIIASLREGGGKVFAPLIPRTLHL